MRAAGGCRYRYPRGRPLVHHFNKTERHTGLSEFPRNENAFIWPNSTMLVDQDNE